MNTLTFVPLAGIISELLAEQSVPYAETIGSTKPVSQPSANRNATSVTTRGATSINPVTKLFRRRPFQFTCAPLTAAGKS